MKPPKYNVNWTFLECQHAQKNKKGHWVHAPGAIGA